MSSSLDASYINGRCLFCDDEIASTERAGVDLLTSCMRCGSFRWENRIPPSITLGEEERVRLAGYVQDANAVGIIPFMTAAEIRIAIARKRPPLLDRAFRLLRRIADQLNQSTYTSIGSPEGPTAFGMSYSKDVFEIRTLTSILEDQGFIKEKGTITLTPRGLLELEAVNNSNRVSPQGFIAMSFDPSMDGAWLNGFEPGVLDAGYKAVRIDQTEHNRSISDEIMAHIRRSRFVVADYTYSNNGVYFEAGFALGCNIQVIPTCHEDHMQKLHFDIRHINTLLWKEPGDLRERLARRIAAVIGEGPEKR